MRNSISVRIWKTSEGDYRVSYRDPITNKRVRKRVKTKTQALSLERKIINDYANGRLPQSSSRTFKLLFEKFTSEHPEVTKSFVQRRIDFIVDYLGRKDISDVDLFALKSCFSELKKKYDLQDKTLNRTKAQIAPFFKWLAAEGIITTNPLRMLSFSEKGYKNPPVVLTPTELQDILLKAKNFEDGFLYDILFVFAWTAARRGELLKLKWSDVDFGLNTLTFRVTKTITHKTLPMSPKLADHMRALPRKGSYVFQGKNGGSLSDHTLRSMIDRFKERHKFEKNWNTKSFRHSFCRMAKLEGWQPYAIQKYLGHETLEVTMKVYGQTMATDFNYDHPLDTLF